MSIIEITGGAGPRETAAIMAIIAGLLADEETAMAQPSNRPRQSQWVLAWRPREVPAALPSHTYDAVSWSEVEGAEEEPA